MLKMRVYLCTVSGDTPARDNGVRIGALVGPMGTVLCGVTGSIVGGIMGEGVQARSTKPNTSR